MGKQQINQGRLRSGWLWKQAKPLGVMRRLRSGLEQREEKLSFVPHLALCGRHAPSHQLGPPHLPVHFLGRGKGNEKRSWHRSLAVGDGKVWKIRQHHPLLPKHKIVPKLYRQCDWASVSPISPTLWHMLCFSWSWPFLQGNYRDRKQGRIEAD